MWRKWRLKVGKFLGFLRKKVYFDVRNANAIGGAWPYFRRTHYSWALGDFPRVLGRRDFLSFGNVKFLINLKVFALFRLINHIKPAKHRRQLTYQDPSFQWLKVLLLGVEKWRINLDFFGCFCEKNFYAYLDIPVRICLGHFPTNHCSEAIRIIGKNYYH